jgi:hypothetical protein
LNESSDDEEADNLGTLSPKLKKALSSPVGLDESVKLYRSKTQPALSSNKKQKELSSNNLSTDRLKMAKEEAERAIKVKI